MYIKPPPWAMPAPAPPRRPTLDEWKMNKEFEEHINKHVIAKQSKMAAVDKVISMVESLREKVMSDGTKEAKTYNEFACFCKTTQKSKNEDIDMGSDDKEDLSAFINECSATRDELDQRTRDLQKDIADLARSMELTGAQRAADKKEYDSNAADLAGAIFGLENAISVLKASKTNASDTIEVKLLQVQSLAKTVRTAMQLADTMGLVHKKSKAMMMLLQNSMSEQPFPDSPATVEMQDYKFHSGDIIETLEQLLKQFKKARDEVDAAEVQSIQEFEQGMQTMKDMTKTKEKELAQTKMDKDKKIDEIASASEELSAVSSSLLANQEYLSELNTMCSEKAQTWDQRNSVRAAELSALTSALDILKTTVTGWTTESTMRLLQQGQANTIYGSAVAKAVAQTPSAMEALESIAESEESEESPTGFLQRRQEHKSAQPHVNDVLLQDQARDAVARMLRGSKYKSTLLTELASRIQAGADPFAKIKVMIQAMIEKLLNEESSEGNEKGFCDKATGDATLKRDQTTEKVEALNVELAEREATLAKDKAQMISLHEELFQVHDEFGEAQHNYFVQTGNNHWTIQDAEIGLKAIDEAIIILTNFYKTMSKSKIALSLAQAPADDAPMTTFKIGEAYTGAQAESGGVIGMMEVIRSDFERTITLTHKAQEEADAEFNKFSTESAKTLVKLQQSMEQLSKLGWENFAIMGAKRNQLHEEMDILKATIKTLIELKARCIDTGMSYDERVARREDEISDLKKALCILENYQEYGVDGSGGDC